MALMTKEEYLSSLRKLEHRVFIQGERVESVPDHPISGPPAKDMAETLKIHLRAVSGFRLHEERVADSVWEPLDFLLQRGAGAGSHLHRSPLSRWGKVDVFLYRVLSLLIGVTAPAGYLI